MHVSAQLAPLIAIMSVAVIYGTDAFCALVQRPALARVNDATLTAVMGNVHRYGDRRLPVPGILGMIASGTACVLAAVDGRAVASASAGAALLLLISWLLIYIRISAPINRALTAAVDRHETPTDARSLQHDWDRIITLRATLQGLAVAALCINLISDGLPRFAGHFRTLPPSCVSGLTDLTGAQKIGSPGPQFGRLSRQRSTRHSV